MKSEFGLWNLSFRMSSSLCLSCSLIPMSCCCFSPQHPARVFCYRIRNPHSVRPVCLSVSLPRSLLVFVFVFISVSPTLFLSLSLSISLLLRFLLLFLFVTSVLFLSFFLILLFFFFFFMLNLFLSLPPHMIYLYCVLTESFRMSLSFFSLTLPPLISPLPSVCHHVSVSQGISNLGASESQRPSGKKLGRAQTEQLASHYLMWNLSNVNVTSKVCVAVAALCLVRAITLAQSMLDHRTTR